MSLFDILEDDLQSVIFSTEDFAKEAIYTPSGGSPVETAVIFSPQEDLDDAQWRAALQASANLWVHSSEVASPAPNDTVTIDGETWTVVRRISRSGCLWHLETRRDLRPTFRK